MYSIRERREKKKEKVNGKCVRTGAKTMVVDGGDQKPLALLRLASGPPLMLRTQAI